MSRGHSCVLDMKTQCMRTKSSTAGSDTLKENNREKRREESEELGLKSQEQNIENAYKTVQILQYSSFVRYLVHWDVCLSS